jgi:hypothetical protein
MRFTRIRSSTLCLLATGLCAAEPAMVSKLAEPCEGQPWIAGQWSTAKISSRMVTDVPAAEKAQSQQAMVFQIGFDGSGFQHAALEPVQPLWIPGKTKALSVWYHGDGQDAPLALKFADAWGRSEVDGRKFEWQIGTGTGKDWQKATFTIPDGWQMPLRIVGFSSHNWGNDRAKRSIEFTIDQLQVDTDLSGTDPETGRPAGFIANPDPKKKDEALPFAPLLMAAVSSGLTTESFIGLTPTFTVAARNWQAGTLTGDLHWKLSVLNDGVIATPVSEGGEHVSVDSMLSRQISCPVPRYGLYRLDATLAWSGRPATTSAITFAALPPQPTLSDAQKDASPWGLNIHGGFAIFPDGFTRAGIVWFRDYAFNYPWMERAKGKDKSYSDWPWYPKLMASYDAAGARLLPVLVDSIKVLPGNPPPDRDWRRSISDIITAFPQVKAWELDNEMDGGWMQRGRDDAKAGWANYKAYHQAFGEVVKAVGGKDLLAVENGRAGIYPSRVADCVAKGVFAGIDVVNGHHYCGIDAPELNIANQNTGGGGDDPELFHDRMRGMATAGRSDGKARQAWLTEFGWDTRAAKIVSPKQQAAFLQRGFLVAFHAGIDKAFWYWWQDEEKVGPFFSGCGLTDYKHQPKLAYAALAGITSLLPNPRIGGTIDAGAGTFGFLIRQDDRRIAALWNLDSEDGPNVTFASGTLQDYLGNALPGHSAKLGLAPLYVLELAADDRLVKQASWDLAGKWLSYATAGDATSIDVALTGDRAATINGTVTLEGPSGWTLPAAQDVSAAPGASRAATLTCTIPATAKAGEYRLNVTINEGGKVLKQMPFRVIVREPLTVTTTRLSGEPGAGSVSVQVHNRSRRALGGDLSVQLPVTWSTTVASKHFAEIPAGETVNIDVPVTWAATWAAGEQARVSVKASDGSLASAGIVPGGFTLHRVQGLKLDGDLSDWPAATVLPTWAIASSAADPGAEVRLGWSDEGLLLGYRVTDSTLTVADPEAFWDADAMEFLIDPRSRRGARPNAGGERQFWFVPQPATQGVYVGQWKRGKEIAATRKGIPDTRGASRKVGDGYCVEVVVPAALLPDVVFKPGTELSALMLLKVHGRQFDRDLGWPATKSAGTGGGPETWPLLRLAE